MDANHPWVAKRRRHGSKKTTRVIKVVLLLFNPYIHGPRNTGVVLLNNLAQKEKDSNKTIKIVLAD